LYPPPDAPAVPHAILVGRARMPTRIRRKPDPPTQDIDDRLSAAEGIKRSLVGGELLFAAQAGKRRRSVAKAVTERSSCRRRGR
jgi:hypothetical protein